MPSHRNYVASDLAALYEIALATGESGADAADRFEDPVLVGHVYAAPYAVLEPRLALVVEDDRGVAGYCVGALRTQAFEALLEREWWPVLRRRYPAVPTPQAPNRATDDARIVGMIHQPPRTPDWLSERYLSHLHMNLLPRLQGRGCGRELLTAWRARARDLGSTGFHLGVSETNTRAIGFYEAVGLTRLHAPGGPADDGIWFGGV